MNTFTLKIAACLLMVIDHTALFFPHAIELPMHWIGRLAAPLFTFLCVQACEHTHSIFRYIMRLYTASVGVAFMELILNRTGNAFTPLFHVALIIGILSLRKPPHRVAGLAAYCLWQVTLYLLFTAAEPSISELDILPRLLVEIVAPTALGMGISIDGGYAYVMLGLIMWVCRKSRYRLAIWFTVFCGAIFILFNYAPLTNSILPGLAQEYLGLPVSIHWMPFTYNYQWMMIGALPFMLLYNGQRGRPVKWLFYWFYPVHLTVITILMHLLGAQFYGA
ncbi:protein TraX [Bifidobacterium pullorum subsp. saeculare DSM 6531 = LMG 14934]|uniref:Protein TraX n=1 Tax=Bifidobacterium pullorum subsp. saeculare DSM 6531 = LMG 14934 TaxID=1437611 RepID=A0A087CTB4_9BIFI|nr:TraX family protein [Bifidobacterium pullorum]KFI86514.1 protein TraX [Bifidobacterium pullorum subsp. saeculare DSM 6531 = LMG 14934]